MYTIADFTRVHPGTEPSIVNSLIQLESASPSEKITLFKLENQLVTIPQTLAAKSSQIPVPFNSTPFAIADYIFNHTIAAAAYGSGAQDSRLMRILSFHPVVLALVTKVPPHARPHVHAYSWSEVHRMFTAPKDTHPERQYIEADFLSRLGRSKLELISTIKSVLERHLRPLRFTDVRTVFAVHDISFDKSNPAVNYPGFVGELVRFAEENKLVTVDRITTPTNWTITVVRSSEPDAFTPPPARSSTVTADLSSESHLQDTSNDSKSSPNPSSAPQKWAESRSQQFIDVLTQRRLGPFSRVRLQIYSSLAEILRNNPDGITVGELLRRSVSQVKTLSHLPEFPWRSVSAFLANLLTKRPVLLDASEKPVAVSFSTMSSKVTHLDSEWESKLDGELILTLAAEIEDIQFHDIPQLAGALFLDRGDVSQERVIRAIEEMLRDGKLEDVAGVIRVTSVTVA